MNIRHALRVLACQLACFSTMAMAAVAGPFSVSHVTVRTLSLAQFSAIQTHSLAGKEAPSHKELILHRGSTLVIWTGPENDMLSFRIKGLRNPTLVIPRGATVPVLFVNTDDDMYHDWRVGSWRAAYPNDASALVKASVGTPPLAHKTDTAYHAESLLIKAPAKPGKYAYFCTVRGHAQGGMWGTLIVR